MKHISRVISTLLMLFLLTTSIYSQPQNRRGIQGQIVDSKSGLQLSQANILLYESNSTNQLKGTASDNEGSFYFYGIDDGNYDLRIRVLGFEVKVIEDVTISTSSPVINLGEISMVPSTLDMPDVEYQVEGNEVMLSADRKVYRLSKNIADAGGSVADALEEIPSVSVDIEGNVSLRGSENVRILIDGKPSSRIGMNAAEALQQLPAEMIEQVEVMTNPSAKYDAQGDAGIINLVLKKQRKKGLNGSTSANVGYPARYGVGINLNYRVGKFNLFFDDNARVRSHTGEGETRQTFYDGNPYASLNQTQDRDRGGWGNRVRVGFEYLPSDINSITFSVFNDYGEDENEAEVNYRYFDAAGNLQSHVRRFDPENETERWNGADIGYTHHFNGDGHDLTVDYKYETGQEDELSEIRETWLYGGGADNGLIQNVTNLEGETTNLFQIDYVNPYSEDKKLEIGAKSNLRNLEHDYTVVEYDSVDAPGSTLDVGNVLLYDEYIHAAYLTFANRVGMFSYQLGVRSEYSDITTTFENTNDTYSRQYLDFFPSAHFTYDLSVVNSIQLSYTRRLDRPHFWHLIPFWNYTDSRNIRRGNPKLDPEYTDSYEISHLIHSDEGSISSGIYYRQTDGVIEWVESIEDSIIVRQPYNLATRDAYGFEWVVARNMTKWLNLQLDFNLYRALTDGNFQGQDFETKYTNWFSRFNSRISFDRRTQLQTRFFYRGPHKSFQGERKAMYSVDLGLSRSLWDNQATLALNVRDLLDSRRREMETFAEDFYSYSKFSYRGRQITLQFTWRFNQDKKKRMNGGNGDGMGMDDFIEGE